MEKSITFDRDGKLVQMPLEVIMYGGMAFKPTDNRTLFLRSVFWTTTDSSEGAQRQADNTGIPVYREPDKTLYVPEKLNIDFLREMKAGISPLRQEEFPVSEGISSMIKRKHILIITVVPEGSNKGIDHRFETAPSVVETHITTACRIIVWTARYSGPFAVKCDFVLKNSTGEESDECFINLLTGEVHFPNPPDNRVVADYIQKEVAGKVEEAKKEALEGLQELLDKINKMISGATRVIFEALTPQSFPLLSEILSVIKFTSEQREEVIRLIEHCAGTGNLDPLEKFLKSDEVVNRFTTIKEENLPTGLKKNDKRKKTEKNTD